MSPNRCFMSLLRGAILLWFTAAIAPGAVAAPAPPAGTKAPPLVVDADHSTAVRRPGADTAKMTYTGHVVVTRGPTVIHGDRAVVQTRHGRLTQAHVTGNPATFTWHGKNGKPVHGSAAQITYLAHSNSIRLQGGVNITRGGEQFSAAEAVYMLQSQTLTASGQGKDRVHAVMPPAEATGGS